MRDAQPGQAVVALQETITVIREVWYVEQRGGVGIDGTCHRVSGAMPDPTPAYDIGI